MPFYLFRFRVANRPRHVAMVEAVDSKQALIQFQQDAQPDDPATEIVNVELLTEEKVKLFRQLAKTHDNLRVVKNPPLKSAKYNGRMLRSDNMI